MPNFWDESLFLPNRFSPLLVLYFGLLMKVAALLSGGKDSCYNMLQCVKRGHEIVCLVNLLPGKMHIYAFKVIENKAVNELDSFMYQTVGHTAIDVFPISYILIYVGNC